MEFFGKYKRGGVIFFKKFPWKKFPWNFLFYCNIKVLYIYIEKRGSMKQRIRLTESDLLGIIVNSVKKLLNEVYDSISIRNSRVSDYDKICELIGKIDGVESINKIRGWIDEEGGLNYSCSFVATDDMDNIVGVCVCTNGSLDDEVPELINVNKDLYDGLNSFRYLMGFGFFIDSLYRGGNLHKRMMRNIVLSAYENGYDFIIIPVYRHLRTHNMYLSYGCIPFYVSDEDVIYYLYPLNKDVVNIVNNYSLL